MRWAWCCWTTKSSGPARAARTAGAGSGVAVKVRLALYSSSGFFATPAIFHEAIFAGASGYSFKEWKGTFYPDKIKPEEMLAFYSARLPTVEINNTFYRMPKTSVLENWAATAPEGFRFGVKASRRITHMARLKIESNVAEPVGFLYKNIAALGPKRGPDPVPVAAQHEEGPAAPPGVPRAAARRTTARRSNSATTPGSTTRCTRR